MIGSMMGVLLLCAAGPQDAEERRERLKDPANVWPIFQELVRDGAYAKAYELLAPATKKSLVYEAFYIAFASYDAPRRMIAKTAAHRAEPGKLLLCSAEFGVSREVKLVKFMGKIWTLEFTPDDLEHLKGRPLDWFRRQVKRADGWHFAYPPDWTYAPLARTCGCGP